MKPATGRVVIASDRLDGALPWQGREGQHLGLSFVAISLDKPCSGDIFDLKSVNYISKNATFQLLDI